MTVYIEYVLIDNFVIDYLLLQASHKIAGVSAKKSRLCFCAVLGALVALACPVLENFKPLLIAVKVACGLLIPLLSANFRSTREYFITAALFLCLTFLSGGAVTGVFGIFGLSYSSEISVALMFLPAWAAIVCVKKAVKFVYKRKDLTCFLYRVTLFSGGNSVEVTGFLDTGNGVYDGDSPVVFLNSKTARKLFIGKDGKPVPLKRITVKTVSGESEKICFKLDRLVIYTGDIPNIFNNVTVCVADGGAGAGYDLILHPAFIPARTAA